MRPTAIRIAVIGDVHDQWDDTDGTILKQLNVHLALFVGDFGNESVDVVRRIARLDLPKAVVLGNHDAWYTATDWGRRKCPYDRTQEDRFQQQLDLFGSDRVGYGLRDFPELGVSVIGGRPCSWGGPTWKYTDFYQTWFGVSSFEESTQRIVESAKRATCNTLIFLGHNGPTGLGDAAEDPCGRDWNPLGGDFGDRDFAEAIATIRGDGKSIPLVTFGHMHHRLRHTKTRLRRSVCFDDAGTLYLNVASVPRVMEIDRRIARNFSIVTLENGCVTDAALCWVDDDSQTLQEIPYFDRADEELTG
ncbi:Metallophosphoesterase [Geitlerinema sp. FC II]|nr:TIGR04168 family protein [Geitlerinema sp. CS-897]PPT09342.1 Metallophosphoesterase [Geitlerinema sp. FC II]